MTPSAPLPKLDLTYTTGQYLVAQMTFENSEDADKYLLKQPKEAVMLSSVHELLEEIEMRVIEIACQYTIEQMRDKAIILTKRIQEVRK